MRTNAGFKLLFCLSVMALLTAACAQNTPEAVYSRGERAYQEGDVIGASIQFEDFIKKFPDDDLALNAYNYLANCHIRMKDFGNARIVFEEVKEKFGSTNPAIATACDFQIARTYMDEGNLVKAEELYGGIIDSATAPDAKYNAYQSLALGFAQQRQIEKSIEQFDSMIQVADEDVQDPTQQFYMKLEAMVGNGMDGVPGKADIFMASREFGQARDTYLGVVDLVNSVTGIFGLENERQNALIGWAHSWVKAGDYISAATTYDKLLDNPYIMDDLKPQLILWKVQSMERLLQESGAAEYTPEDKAILVRENQRVIDGYPESQQATQAMVSVANLVKDTTPEMMEEYIGQIVARFEKQFEEPTSPREAMDALANIAEVYIQVGKYDDAKQALERVKKSYSNIEQVQGYVAQRLQFIEDVQKQAAAAPQEQPATE